MHDASPWLARLSALNALGWLGFCASYIYGQRHIPRVSAVVPPAPGAVLPPLTIVFTALNEAAAIGATLSSLLAQKYPGPLEIVAVDDRSTDATGRIIQDFAAADPRVTAVSVTDLPPGWLGKNHALHRGVQRARQRDGWLLFTDADVVFAPDALARAVRSAEQRRLDHLVAFPDLMLRSPGEKTLVSAFTLLFWLRFQSWLVPQAWAAHAYAGVGAFNLVRRAVYDAIGGHTQLRMDVADDVKLGKQVKGAGFRQGLVGGRDSVRVKWQANTWGIIRGFEKNGFGGFDYSVAQLVAGTLGLLYFNVFPFLALTRSGPTRRWAALTLACIAAVYGYQAARTEIEAYYALVHPVGIVLFVFAMWRSAYLALRRGGIEWRGSFYPLADLRHGLV